MNKELLAQVRRIMWKNEQTAELLDRLEWRITKQSDMLEVKRMILVGGKETLV